MQIKLTPIGTQKIAASMAGGPLFAPATIVLSDGGASEGLPYTVTAPDGSETEVANEVARFEATAVYRQDEEPSDLIVEAVVPVTAGDFWVTEAGIFDADGDLVAITAVPVFQKIASSSGSYDDLVLEFVLGVGANAVVNVTLDPSAVLATRAYVQAQFEGIGASIFFHGFF